MIAYVWANGELGFGEQLPPDALPIVVEAKEGSTQLEWMASIKAGCRLSYDGEAYLVPGIPEAETEEAKLDALIRFTRWMNGLPDAP